MTTGFMILTVLFIIISAVMILIVLVQRPQGGGLAGAFGGAGGGSTDTVFGGRVGDALTVMTVITFAGYLLLAIGLNVMDNNRGPAGANTVLTSGDGATTMPAQDASTTPPRTNPPVDARPPVDDAPDAPDAANDAADATDADEAAAEAIAPADAPPGQ